MKNYYFSIILLMVTCVGVDFRSFGQCCAAGTSGVVEYTSNPLPTNTTQSGTGSSWTTVSGSTTVGDGSSSTNSITGVDLGLLISTTTRTLNISVPAFAIPAGRRFCSASITINYSISYGPVIIVFIPVQAILFPYATVTAAPATITQAQVTSGFTATVNATYGFTGIGRMTVSVDGITVNVITQAGCPLPAELIDFSGQQEEMCAGLQWSTASEKDNDFFSVEKLVGQEWIEIGKVNSKHGTTQEREDYEFTDCQASEMNYYRLSQTDRNGAKEQIADAISVGVELDAASDVVMFPNPAETITCFATDQRIKSVRIIAMNGATVGELQVPEEEQNERVCLPLDDLIKGVYTVQIETGRGLSTKKLVVQ